MNSQHPRVLIVVSKFPPHAGGTSVVWGEWCRCWPAAQIKVIAPQVPDSQTFDRAQAYPIVRIRYPDIPKLRMPLLWLLLAGRCLWECLLRRPKVIHFQHVFENAFIGPLLARLLKTPYWVHVYAEELAMARRHAWLHRFVLFTLNRAQGVTAISHFTRDLLREMGYSGPCLLVHPAVDTDRYHPDGPASPKFGSGPKLLTIGRLMKRKGHEKVLQVLPDLLKEYPDLQYLIIGNGPEELNLKKTAKSLGIDSSTLFLGKLSDSELIEIMRACDIFVHPNWVTESDDVEGFGIVFLEAAACGLVTIGGANGGTPDSVAHLETGFLINPQQPEELRLRLKELLESPSLRKSMGQAGIRFARSFRWEWAAERVWKASVMD